MSSLQDEFHSRLKFNRRGLVGMASGGTDDNGSQFFITLNRVDELTKKHTMFGKARIYMCACMCVRVCVCV